MDDQLIPNIYNLNKCDVFNVPDINSSNNFKIQILFDSNILKSISCNEIPLKLSDDNCTFHTNAFNRISLNNIILENLSIINRTKNKTKIKHSLLNIYFKTNITSKIYDL